MQKSTGIPKMNVYVIKRKNYLLFIWHNVVLFV